MTCPVQGRAWKGGGMNKVELIKNMGTGSKNKYTHPEHYIKIESMEDIMDKRNAMIKGNYPASMTDCEVVGINGDCGKECIVYLEGRCDCEDEVNEMP